MLTSGSGQNGAILEGSSTSIPVARVQITPRAHTFSTLAGHSAQHLTVQEYCRAVIQTPSGREFHHSEKCSTHRVLGVCSLVFSRISSGTGIPQTSQAVGVTGGTSPT